MFDERTLQRLAESVTPSDRLARKAKSAVFSRIKPEKLLAAVEQTVPGPALQMRLRDRIMQLVRPKLGSDLGDLAQATNLPALRFSTLKQLILSRLQPPQEAPRIHSAIRWAAAFAVFIILLRAMPLVFLAPATRADFKVQLIPNGEEVSVFVGGVWRAVNNPEVINNPIMIRTGNSRATIILNDDGVLRMAAETTLKLHVVADHIQTSSLGPTATLIRGQVWILGLLSPVSESLTIETPQGILALNSGSASVGEDGRHTVVGVYDRGATFQYGKQVAFLVSGESVTAKGNQTFDIVNLQASAFSKDWVSGNLEQDAAHRSEIAKMLERQREQMAGILPTSFLYPAKRMAEEVDVFFTLTHDGKTEKRIQQANTRLNEALALLKEGQSTEAVIPLTEYRDSLIAMASGTGDNLVKFLIKKQIADASSTLNAQVPTPASTELLKNAVIEISAAIPDTALKAKDIEGYVLVDKLSEINLSIKSENLTGGLIAYAEVQPYLKELLSENAGAHPLLQKEARALLVTTNSLIKDAVKGSPDKIAQAVQTDIAQYLPPEPEQVLVSEEELNIRVQDMIKRILVFKAPRSRYNQLLLEMSLLKGDPNRGTLLRRLYRELPENGIGGYVLTEIKNLGDELKQEGK
jgi:hypothetical protein